MNPSSHQRLQSTEYVKALDRQIFHCIGCVVTNVCLLYSAAALANPNQS